MSVRFLSLSLILLGLAGCGQGTEPISTLGDPTQSLTSSFSLPYSTTPISFTGYSTSSTDGSGFDFNFTTTGIPVLAPARGLVMDVNTSAGTLLLMHNVRVYSRIKGVNASGVVVGSIVQQGNQIGTTSTSSLRLSVIVDGSYVCPLSYLTGSARTSLVSTISGVSVINPCAQ